MSNQHSRNRVIPEIKTPLQVKEFLQSIDYPVAKTGLVDQARAEGVGKEILHNLQRLPERQFDSPIRVSYELALLHWT